MSANATELNLDRISVREILNALADGAYVTDANRRIVFWNRAATRITGWGAGEVVGRSCSDNILVHMDKDGHALCGQEYCPLYRSMATGRESEEPLLVFAQHRGGQRIPVEVTVAPIFDQNEKVVGGIEVFRDLTEMMSDLRKARVIQDHSLGGDLPGDPRLQFAVRYSPAEVVGGDFYRLESLGSDRYAVLVADVMGHGIASALYTMQLRALWDDGREWLATPGSFLAELNRRLSRLVDADGYFATGVMVVVDAASGELRLVRAGHAAPLLVSAGGGVRSIGGRSPALGLVQEATYAETVEHLGPGETLLLFTDGATEIVNAAGEELGEEGLCRILQAGGFAGGTMSLDRVERLLLDFSQRIRLADDLTLLSIHRA